MHWLWSLSRLLYSKLSLTRTCIVSNPAEEIAYAQKKGSQFIMNQLAPSVESLQGCSRFAIRTGVQPVSQMARNGIISYCCIGLSARDNTIPGLVRSKLVDTMIIKATEPNCGDQEFVTGMP